MIIQLPARWLLLPDILIPDPWIGTNIPTEHLDALGRAQVDDLDAVLAQPLDAAAEIHGFADHDGPDIELAHQAAAVPAGRERRDHDLVAVAALPAGLAEGIGFAVN